MQAGESPDVSVPLAHYLLLSTGPDRTSAAFLLVDSDHGHGSRPARHRRRQRASLEPVFQQAAREGWLAGRPAGTSVGRTDAQPAYARRGPWGQGENDTRRQFSAPLRTLMGLVSLRAGGRVRERREPAARTRSGAPS